MTPLEQLLTLEDGARAATAAAYHKAPRRYLGLAVPQVEELVAAWRADRDIAGRVALAAELWDSDIHEARIAAAKLLTQARMQPDDAVWSLFLSWVPQFDAWAIADTACDVGSRRLLADPSRIGTVEGWTRDDNKWVRRAALVADRLDKATGEPWTATADDVAWFGLEMASGELAQVFVSGVAAHNMGNHTQVFGSRGTITLSNDDEKLWFAKAGQSFEDITRTDPIAGLPGLNKGIWNVSVVSALPELCGAITEGRALRQGATFADGLANQRVLDAVRLSGAECRWVRPEDVDA